MRKYWEMYNVYLVRIFAEFLPQEPVAGSAGYQEQTETGTQPFLLACTPAGPVAHPEPVPNVGPRGDVGEESNRLHGTEGADSRHANANGCMLGASNGEKAQQNANRCGDGDEDKTSKKGGVQHDIKGEGEGRAWTRMVNSGAAAAGVTTYYPARPAKARVAIFHRAASREHTQPVRIHTARNAPGPSEAADETLGIRRARKVERWTGIV